MFKDYGALTRNALGGRMNLWAAFEPRGAYLGCFTLDELHDFAQAQGFWVDCVKYTLVGQCVDELALAWRPNGLPAGDTVWSFTGFRVSPTREIGDTGEIEVCDPGEHHLWSIYGFHRDAEEWQVVHDAERGDVGEALARIVTLTGELIEYRDNTHAYANTRLADLPVLLAQRVHDEAGDDGARTDETNGHPLTALREEILAALEIRGM